MKLGMQVGLGPSHIVLDGDPAPPKGAQPPIFGPCPLRCGQMAGWIKMPLGTEVGLGPGGTVLDGDPAPPKKEAQPSNFRLTSVVAKWWMDEDATWYGGIPWPR